MPDTFHTYVEQIAQAYAEALKITAPAAPPPPPVAADAPCVVLVMPHPDDECITGALAVRLRRACGARVVNIGVTLGSNPARQAGRRQELTAACSMLGFETVVFGEHGLDNITPAARTSQPAVWRAHTEMLAACLREYAPRLVIIPHDNDWHPTHIGTHLLACDALALQPRGFTCGVVETEYWFPMAAPNLAVELSARDLADLMAALACHRGEVQRNPYHVRLPAWMMDNVRRMELMGGKGTAVSTALFATLYRARRWAEGMLHPPCATARVISCADSPADMLS